MKLNSILKTGKLAPAIAVVVVAMFLMTTMAAVLGNEKSEYSAAVSFSRSTSIILVPRSSDVNVGENIHVDGVLKYVKGINNARVSVKVTLPDGTSTVPKQGSTVVTDSAGKFSMDYVATKAGKYVFSASYSGTWIYRPSSASTTVTANDVTSPQPVRWTWMESPSSCTIGQSNTYKVKFEVLLTDGTWVGAGTTRIDFAFTNPSGVKTILSATTPADTTGLASVTFTPDVAGTWTVKCDWDHNNQIYAWDSSPVAAIIVSEVTPPVAVKQSTSITVSAPTGAQTGTAQTITGTLRTTTGNAVSGATVTVLVHSPNDTVLSNVNVITNSNGVFTTIATPVAVGTHQVTATYVGDDSFNGATATTSFMVSTPSPLAAFDYIVSTSQVKTPTGAVAYTGSSFTAALQWAVSQAGKTVYVPAGTYTVTAGCMVASGVTLYGDGPETTGTVFNYTVSRTWKHNVDGMSDIVPLFYALDVNDVTLKKFRGINYALVAFGASDGVTCGGHLCEDVWLDRISPNGWMSAFTALADNKKSSTGGVLDDITFRRCTAYHTGTCGFFLFGWSSGRETPTNGGWIKNAVLEDCVADHCGSDTTVGRYGDYCVAYDLAEQVNVDGLTVNRCQALYGWEDGFHFEMWPIVKNAVFNQCIANYNGVKPNAEFGQGFFWVPGYTSPTLNDCNGVGNKKGTNAIGYSDCPIADLTPVG